MITLLCSKFGISTNCLLYVIIVHSFCLTSTKAKLELPKISILSNRLVNSENLNSRNAESFNISLIDITIQKSQTVYTIPQEVMELTVTCNASYPVTWNFQESQIHSQAFYLISVKSLRMAGEIFDTSTFNYSTHIHFFGENNKLTGKYVCSSTAQASIQSSVFMYWEGISSSILLYSQENMTVYLENNKAVLPCIVTKRDSAMPQLRKEIFNVYEDIRLNKSVSYNPQIGFTFNNVPFPIGTYKCVFSDSDYVMINVSLRNTSECLLSKSNASFTYNETSNEVTCCSNSQKPPNLHMYYCNHASTCAFRSTVHINNFWFSRRKRKIHCSTLKVSYFETSVVRCLGDGIDTYKEIIKPVRKIAEPWNPNKTSPAYFNWQEIEHQNMLDVSSINYIRYPGPLKIRPSPPGLLPNPEIFYSGQQKIFVCKISLYYFSEGVQWAIKWKNSTLTLFKNNQTNSNRRHYYGRGTGRPLDVILDIEMNAVICFAPVWNSSVWVPKTKYLYVNESKTPSLLDDHLEFEKLTWMVNDTRRTISCSASGVPTPMITWTKENKILSNTTNLKITYVINEVNKTLRSDLTVLRVSYGTQGDYLCNASNFGGFVKVVFHVGISEHYSWTQTILITMAIFVVVFLLIGLILIYRKMDKDKKAIEHLSTVAFKDVSTRQEASGTDVINSSVDNGKMTNNLLVE